MLAMIGAFVLGDLALFAALPRLGLSFGPVLFSVLCTAWGRTGISLIFLPAAKLSRQFSEKRTLILVNLFLSACLIDSLYIEPFSIKTTRFTQASPAISAGSQLKALHISDLHVERKTMREEKLLHIIDAEKPDIIFLTGDYVNLSMLNDAAAINEANAFFKRLTARFGVFAISGTTDPPALMEAVFRETNILNVDDRSTSLRTPVGLLLISGLSWQSIITDVLSVEATRQKPSDYFSVLLAHSPDLIIKAADYDFDLYLAGHTHGGQIRVPWYGALVTFSRFGKAFEAGYYKVKNTALYVSRGLGMEGFWWSPRMRFLCPPEVVVITLKGAESPNL